jgi:hypothetical protein
MTQAVYDLTVAAPHEARARGYSPAQWLLYVEGYAHALVMALRVLRLAVDRWVLSERERRRRRRAECAAARASAELNQPQRGELAGVRFNHPTEKRVQRRQRVDWEHEGKTLLAHRVVTDDGAASVAGGAFDRHVEAADSGGLSHAAQFVVERDTEQRGSEKQITSKGPKENTSTSGGGDGVPSRTR